MMELWPSIDKHFTPLPRALARTCLALLPLLLTVLFAFLVAEGHLGFGGGEKDLFLVVPLAIWSLVYLGSCLVLWWRRAGIGRSIAVASATACGVVVVAWLVLFGVSWFGLG